MDDDKEDNEMDDVDGDSEDDIGEASLRML
jgi:hypothetical protein